MHAQLDGLFRGRHPLTIVALLLSGCGETTPGDGPPAVGTDGGPDRGGTECGRVACPTLAGVAESLGCAPDALSECTCPDQCTMVAKALFDCIAADPSQCLCESDGDLNCEGAWKPNEGHARCVAEWTEFNQCDEATAASCAERTESCQSADCCEGLHCVDGICQDQPAPCATESESCASNDCCEPLSCVDSVCRTMAACASVGESCASSDCCEGLICSGSVCGE